MVVGGPSVVHAQDDAQRAAARGLATDGLRAYEAGRWAEGLDLFQRAEALVHAPPHLLYIARASAKQGKLVQANEAYMKILREPLAATAPKAFVDAQKAAHEEHAELAPRVPKLTIVLKGEAAGDANVTMDGVEVPRALVGVAQPADPGAHVLKATAPGWASRDVNIQIAEGSSETATVVLDQRIETPDQPHVDQDTGPGPETKRGTSVLPWVAIGVGVAGLGAGTFFMIQNRSARDDANALCGDGPCPAARRSEIQALDSDADTAATLSWIGYGVGAAGIIAGAALLVVNKTSSSKTAGTSVQPWVGAGSAGLVGRF